MGGETDLAAILRSLTIHRQPEPMVMQSIPVDEPLPDGLNEALIVEAEGTTAVRTLTEAQTAGWSTDEQFAWLTVEAHTSLQAVGLTAALSTALADRGIACNVIAGYFHDHLLVPWDRAEEAVAVLEALGEPPTRPYAPSHWTFAENDASEKHQRAGSGLGANEHYQGFYDICAIEFTKDARLVDRRQIDAVVEAIEQARAAAGGATVMLFVHGWHNNADWNNKNFADFRKLVRSMAVREYERDDKGRRVVGIYLGWEGGADRGAWSALAKLALVNYWNRDRRARSVATSTGLRTAIDSIITATKRPGIGKHGKPDNSPLMLTGHSMGGLILEQAMLHWVTTSDPIERVTLTDESERNVELTINGLPVEGPDLVLLLNPAAGADDTQNLVNALATKKWAKRTVKTDLSYEPPVVVSLTSSGDKVMKFGFRVLNAVRRLKRLSRRSQSAGFIDAMHTHNLEVDVLTAVERASRDNDRGQLWHGIAFDPAMSSALSPTVTIALPTGETEGDKTHQTYFLRARNPESGSPMWIFDVPDGVIDDHNDVFNPKATSLFLALAQASGAVASLNYDWAELFSSATPR